MAFSSLFIGATGIITHGERMQVISNNLANVSTTGYKKSDALFSDLISQQMASGGHQRPSGAVQISQKGMGVTLGEIRTSFVQGGVETTSQVTDLAIGGRGFFGVSDATAGEVYYTRSGVFRFDQQGFLRDPHGNILQGAEYDRETGELGSVGDVQLPYETETVDGVEVPVIKNGPKATTAVEISTNLDYNNGDTVRSVANPFFSLYEAWDGTAEDPIGGFGGFQTGIKVYDEDGEAHTINYYYDEVDPTLLSNAVPGRSYWEFLVTVDPEEDGRAGIADTSGAGLMATGIFTFNNFGELTDQALYTLDEGGDFGTLSNWSLATFSDEGAPTVSFTWDGGGTQAIGMDFGLTSSNASWLTGAATAGGVGTNVDNLGVMDNPQTDAVVRTTNYDKGSVALYQSQDGYASGYLKNINIAPDGVMEGHFTNGVIEPLYRIALYRFNSEDGLRRLGSNLFGATEQSGDAIEGLAQEDGRGDVYGKSLEMSNVDMAEEFTRLITTQRGFQANTKVITTSDSILNTAISVKR